MRSNLAMVENMPEDAYADLERLVRLDERKEDLLQSAKDCLSLFDEPCFAAQFGGAVHIVVSAAQLRTLMSDMRRMTDYVEQGPS